jgi:hypothetical protein
VELKIGKNLGNVFQITITLIKVIETLVINPDNNVTQPTLTRDLVWDDLLMEVCDARPCVPLMTEYIITK